MPGAACQRLPGKMKVDMVEIHTGDDAENNNRPAL
jgi:hypothetical protein